jgi:hypothetical protein
MSPVVGEEGEVPLGRFNEENDEVEEDKFNLPVRVPPTNGK